MANAPGWLRKFHTTRAEAAEPLLICPHAGGGAATYRPFSKALSAHFEVGLFQYPGRQDRAAERQPDTLPEVAAGAFESFVRSPLNTGKPVTIFGHSMGAIVAFEIARLAEQAGVPLRLLAVSGAVAPSQVADMPSHPTDDEALLDHLSFLQGTGTDLLGNRDLMRMTLPALKADYAAFDRYSCDEDVVLAAPIHAMGGDDDEFVTFGHLHSWQRHTERDIEVTMFDGGHFFLHDHVDGITDVLATALVAR